MALGYDGKILDRRNRSVEVMHESMGCNVRMGTEHSLYAAAVLHHERRHWAEISNNPAKIAITAAGLWFCVIKIIKGIQQASLAQRSRYFTNC